MNWKSGILALVIASVEVLAQEPEVPTAPPSTTTQKAPRVEFVIDLSTRAKLKGGPITVQVPDSVPGTRRMIPFDLVSAERQRLDAIARSVLEGGAHRHGLPYTYVLEDGLPAPIVWLPWSTLAGGRKLGLSSTDVAKAREEAKRGRPELRERIAGSWVYLDPEFQLADGYAFTEKIAMKTRLGRDEIGKATVAFTLAPSSRSLFESLTRRYTGYPLAVCVDREVWGYSMIQEPINDAVILPSVGWGFTEAEHLALYQALGGS